MKRSCFILGCGRSGTSLTAGLLADAGYFMGDQLFAADEGNPRGYFEDHEVNGINEGLLAQLLPSPPRTLTARLLGRPRPHTPWYRWLAELTPDQRLPCPAKFAERIRAQVRRAPFCFKDPRFCYTLGIWREFAPDAAAICVFRHPETSATSIVKEAARNELRLDGAAVNYERALKIWRAMYGYALDVNHAAGGDWLFVHYDQLMTGAGCAALERLLGARVRHDFADPNLRRSATPPAVRDEVAPLYRRLCELAGFDPG